MRKDITVLLVGAVTLATTMTALAQHSDREHDQKQEHPPSHGYGAAGVQEKKQKYTCLMHPEVITDHPGNCPKCGMKLVPLEEKKRQTSNVQRSTSNQT